MASPLFALCCFFGIADWLWLVSNMMALREYAATQGLPPAHAPALFGQIWREEGHQMRPYLEGLIASSVVFLLCVGVALLVNHPSPPPTHSGGAGR